MSPFALALLLPLLAPPAPAAQAASDERLSLEDLLERYRGQRDARLGELRDQVGLLIAELETLGDKPAGAVLEARVARLRELGPSSAPLLVPYLDPGVDATAGFQLRAQLVARVLRDLPTFAVTNELLAILERGTVEGQLNTLRVLARSAEPERVGPVLREYATKQQGQQRESALMALAEVGGAENASYLGELLKKEDGELVRQVLAAVSAAATPAVEPGVLELVRSTSSGAAQVRGIVAYYQACPETVAEAQLDGLLALARGTRTSGDDAKLLLELICRFHESFSAAFKKDLRKVADGSDNNVAEGALIALVLSGDRGAKRELLETYDQRVAESRSWARAYEDRGDIYYRIEDYKSAKKDYEEALRTAANSSRDLAHVHLQIARCNALTGKLKDAKEWIEKAPITLGQRRALAKDPAFAELYANPRYREVFRLEGEGS